MRINLPTSGARMTRDNAVHFATYSCSILQYEIDHDSTTTVCNPLTSFTLTASTYVYNFSLAPSSSFLFLDNRKRIRWGTVLIPLSQTFLFNWGSTRTSFVPYTYQSLRQKGRGYHVQFGKFFDCFDCLGSTLFETHAVDSLVHVWRGG